MQDRATVSSSQAVTDSSTSEWVAILKVWVSALMVIAHIVALRWLKIFDRQQPSLWSAATVGSEVEAVAAPAKLISALPPRPVS